MRLHALVLTSLGAVACGGGGHGVDAASDTGIDARVTADARDAVDAPETAPDAVEAGTDVAGADATGPTRPYALASTGAQLQLAPQPSTRLGPADLATDVDVVLVHQEFYGLPWASFEAGASPPPEWVAVMDDLAANAAAVGPISLSLQLVSGAGRRFLADRAVIAGGAVANPQAGWSAECYDFAAAADGASKRAAYLAYVDWMVRRFRPRFVNVAIEMNMFASCGAGPWAALVDVERAAYTAAKAVDPTAIVFASFQIDLLHGWGPDCATPADRDACFDANYARLANVARDRFAITSFPYLIEALRDPAALPDDWFTRAGDRGGERTIVAETGWLAAPMVVRLGAQCITAVPGSEAAELAYFDRVMAAAARGRMDLVTWASNRDLVPAGFLSSCPCTFAAEWCGFLDALRQSAGADANAQASAEYSIKQFGSMGLRNYDGSPRAALQARWQAARAARWTGPP